MANYNDINANFCQKKITSIKDNSLAVKHIFEFLKCFINKLELKDYKSLVIINENKVIGFDLKDEYELQELIKLYLLFNKKRYEIRVALGLGEELIENYIEFEICLELFNNDSKISIPNLDRHYGNDRVYPLTIGNTIDNTDNFNKLIDRISNRIISFMDYDNFGDILDKKIIELITY